MMREKLSFVEGSLTWTGGSLLRKKALGITTSIWSLVQITVSLSSNRMKIKTDSISHRECFFQTTWRDVEGYLGSVSKTPNPGIFYFVILFMYILSYNMLSLIDNSYILFAKSSHQNLNVCGGIYLNNSSTVIFPFSATLCSTF